MYRNEDESILRYRSDRVHWSSKITRGELDEPKLPTAPKDAIIIDQEYYHEREDVEKEYYIEFDCKYSIDRTYGVMELPGNEKVIDFTIHKACNREAVYNSYQDAKQLFGNKSIALAEAYRIIVDLQENTEWEEHECDLCVPDVYYGWNVFDIAYELDRSFIDVYSAIKNQMYKPYEHYCSHYITYGCFKDICLLKKELEELTISNKTDLLFNFITQEDYDRLKEHKHKRDSFIYKKIQPNTKR